MPMTKKRTPPGGRNTRSTDVKSARRAKPERLEDTDQIKSLKIDPDDRDATKRVTRIKTQVSKRKPPVKARGPSGVTRSAVDRIDDPPPASGVVLIERVLESIERELVAIDKVTGNGHVNARQRTESERRARTLASLAKTLGEVTRLRGLHEGKAKPPDDAAVPRDLDAFRRELARRLEGLAAATDNVPAGGDVGAGDAIPECGVATVCPSAPETA